MALSQRTLETLIDLVEIKLSCMEVYDRDDAREVASLEESLKDLRSQAGHKPQAAPVVSFAKATQSKGPGRRRAAAI